MTATASVEKEAKQTKNQQSLKGVLADVLAKKPAAEVRPQEAPKPPAVSKPAAPHAPLESPPPVEKKPFEVPEDALRKVLKGET